MVGNGYTACSIVSILTVAVATLSVHKLKRWLAMCTLSSIVSTLTVAVATLSVHKLKRWLAMYTPRSIVSTLTVAVAMLSVNKLNDSRQCVYQVLYSVDTIGCSSKA